MKLIRSHLQFATLTQARAAEEAVALTLLALSQENDVFISEHPTVTATIDQDAWNVVQASFAVRQRVAGPGSRIMLPWGVDSVPPTPPAAPHVMLDTETCGNKPGCRVLSIGATVFGPGGAGGWRFGTVLNRHEQEKLVEDPETMAWWAGDARREARVASFAGDTSPPGTTRSGLEGFASWLAEVGGGAPVRVWANGSDFDPPILDAVYDAMGVKSPLFFRNLRCYRTLVKMYPDVPRPQQEGGLAHTALADAVYQANRLAAVLDAADLWGRV